MAFARDTSATAHRIQLDALRGLDGSTRLMMACQMSDEARAISEAGIRHRHPDWADDQVHQALLELLLGPDATRTVLGSRLTRA